MSDKRKKAKRLLVHYFRICAEDSGIKWDSDNTIEVEDIVDHIIDAAKEEMRQEKRRAICETIGYLEGQRNDG